MAKAKGFPTWDMTWAWDTEVRTLKSGFRFQGIVGTHVVWGRFADQIFPDGLLSGLNRAAEMVETYMKANRPWTDRTGDARRGLWSKAWRDGKVFVLAMGHGVHYGIWLEHMQNGRFAIVIPTRSVFAPRLPGIVWGEIDLELRGRGSKFRHRSTGRFV